MYHREIVEREKEREKSISKVEVVVVEHVQSANHQTQELLQGKHNRSGMWSLLQHSENVWLFSMVQLHHSNRHVKCRRCTGGLYKT